MITVVSEPSVGLLLIFIVSADLVHVVLPPNVPDYFYFILLGIGFAEIFVEKIRNLMLSSCKQDTGFLPNLREIAILVSAHLKKNSLFFF